MYKEEIGAGASLLDRYAEDEPSFGGWRQTVLAKSEELDMASAGGCVLGILFHDFHEGRKALGLTWQKAKDHGFYLPLIVDDDNDFWEAEEDQQERYDALTEEWLAYLSA